MTLVWTKWEALSELGDPMKDPLAERACWLAARAPGFSRLLLDSGVVGEYLSGPGTADLGAWLCTLMVQGHPDDVAALLRPYAGQDGWSGRLARVLNAAPLDRSEPAVDLMIAVINAGGLDSGVRDGGGRSYLFSLMHGFRGASSASGSRLLAAWLRRRLALLIADGAYGAALGPAEAEHAAAPGGSGGTMADEEGAGTDD